MSKSTIRGPVGRASTTLVPPIGRPVGHVPTATDGHTGPFRALVVIGRLVWRFRRELTVVVPTSLLGWLGEVLTPVAATSVWLVLIAAMVVLDRRYRVVAGWLARGRLRRQWDRACRMLWLSNLNDHTPRIRRLSMVPAGHRLGVAVPAAVGMAELERNADTLASTLQVQAVRVVRDRGRADRASVTIVQRDPLLEPAPSWPLADTR
jgi:hypothetical protein